MKWLGLGIIAGAIAVTGHAEAFPVLIPIAALMAFFD